VGTAYGSEVTFTTAPACGTTTTVLDIDNNSYNTVSIGTQCWTKENLKVTKYNDGTAIPEETNPTNWAGLATGARAAYDNSNTNAATYGYLYNWYAVNDSKGLCPTGWHVPTDAEWNTLTTFLGGEGVAGGKMKETGTTLWDAPNTGATNESGFSARPGGYRNPPSGSFLGIINDAYFWSATVYDASSAWLRDLHHNNGQVLRNYLLKGNGLSVRCLRD
jgi:uncharacterized protein (TIGR02145 family)